MSSVVAVVGSRIEAEVIAGLLHEHGIRATVSADDLGGLRPDLAGQGVRVLVDHADLAEAQAIIGDVHADAPPPPRKPLNRLQQWLVQLLTREGR